MRCNCFVIALCVLALTGHADCEDTASRDFDFWVGDWDVRLAGGTLAGTNTVSFQEGGCVLLERWRSTRGGTGTSVNFYDLASSRWRQLWVSSEAQIDIAGGIENGSMMMEGYIVYRERGRTRPFRASWTPLADGRVRQFFEEFDDGAWKPWFEGFYSRRPTAGG